MDTKTLGKRIPCLDKGYVELKRAMAEVRNGELVLSDDLAPVNDARTSYLKESEKFTTREEQPRGSDEGLLSYLGKAKPVAHSAPFRGAVFQVEVKAPLLVARQWFKHRVGSVHSGDSSELLGIPEVLNDLIGNGDADGFMDSMFAWNESSRRYITIEPEFYIPPPDKWRSKPDNSKQGSGGFLPVEEGAKLSVDLERRCIDGLKAYEAAMAYPGVAPEQARLYLNGYALYIVWRWTFSLQAGCWFLVQRLDSHAQYEIREYADAVAQLIYPLAPRSIKTLVGRELGEEILSPYEKG